MKKELTERQKQIFEFVRLYIDKYSMPPTRQEVAEAFEFNVNAAQCHLQAIARKGWLSFRTHADGRNMTRGLQIVGN